jgi:hypothetical protein
MGRLSVAMGISKATSLQCRLLALWMVELALPLGNDTRRRHMLPLAAQVVHLAMATAVVGVVAGS